MEPNGSLLFVTARRIKCIQSAHFVSLKPFLVLSPYTPKSLKWLSQVFPAQFSVCLLFHSYYKPFSFIHPQRHTFRPAVWLFSARQLSCVATAGSLC